MSFLKNQTMLDAVTANVPVKKDDPKAAQNAAAQISRLGFILSREGRMSTEDTRKVMLAAMVADAQKRGAEVEAVWNSYPAEAKKALIYTPEDLKRNQDITVFGTKLQAGVFIGSFAASLVAAGAAIKYAKFLPGWAKLPAMVAIPAIISVFLSKMGWAVGTAVNNWNDVFHWGPSFQQQALGDVGLLGDVSGTGGGGGGAPRETPAHTRITLAIPTIEAELAVGTIFQAILKPGAEFRRVVDDAITSGDDLKTDVQLNLNKWLASLPGRLVWEVRSVLNPLDEWGLKRTGTWLMLFVGYRNSQGLFKPLEAIALGPYNPIEYKPSDMEIKSIQLDIPKLLTAEEIMTIDLPTEGLRTVDKKTGKVTPLTFAVEPTTYADLRNDRGTIINLTKGKQYKDVAELAADLGILPHELDWSKIKPAPEIPAHLQGTQPADGGPVKLTAGQPTAPAPALPPAPLVVAPAAPSSSPAPAPISGVTPSVYTTPQGVQVTKPVVKL